MFLALLLLYVYIEGEGTLSSLSRSSQLEPEKDNIFAVAWVDVGVGVGVSGSEMASCSQKSNAIKAQPEVKALAKLSVPLEMPKVIKKKTKIGNAIGKIEYYCK